MQQAGVPNIDLFSPVYGLSDPSTFTFRNPSIGDSHFTRTGAYIQDQIALNDRWLLVLGMCYDDFDDENNLSGFTFSDSAISPRAGVVFKMRPDLSLYASYTEGFNPQRISDQEGDQDGVLNPEDSRQIEAGIKTEWLNGRIQTAAAVYEIVKENVRVGNPDDTGIGDGIPAFLQIGEVKSRGVEIDLVGDLAENWTMTASYAYNSVKITGGNPCHSFRCRLCQ